MIKVGIRITGITLGNKLPKFILAAIVLAFGLLISVAAYAQNKSSMEQRVSTLEAKITELEQKVYELQRTINKLLSTTPQTPNPNKKGNWKNISNWRWYLIIYVLVSNAKCKTRLSYISDAGLWISKITFYKLFRYSIADNNRVGHCI